MSIWLAEDRRRHDVLVATILAGKGSRARSSDKSLGNKHNQHLPHDRRVSRGHLPDNSNRGILGHKLDGQA